MQTDPIGAKDDLNLYAYVGNNPLNATDSMGMEKDSDKDTKQEENKKKEEDEKSVGCKHAGAGCQTTKFHERVADSAKGSPRSAEIRAFSELINPDRWSGPEVSGTIAVAYGGELSLGADSQTLEDGTLSLQAEGIANDYGLSATISMASYRLVNPAFDSKAASVTVSVLLVDVMKNANGDWAVDVHIGVTLGRKGQAKMSTGPSAAVKPAVEARVPLRLRPACFPGEC